ncbi:hypothetical protein ABIC85_001771 [Oerskovia enterophila]
MANLGRPSKGERDHLVTRPSVRLGKTVREAFEASSYDSLSDYLAAVLAEHHGVPEEAPAPRHPLRHQETLKMPA